MADSTKKGLSQVAVASGQWEEWTPMKEQRESGFAAEPFQLDLEGDVLSCQDELGTLAEQVSKHKQAAQLAVSYTAATFSNTPILNGQHAINPPGQQQQPTAKGGSVRQPSPGYGTVYVTPIQQRSTQQEAPVWREAQPLSVAKPLLTQFEADAPNPLLLPLHSS